MESSGHPGLNPTARYTATDLPTPDTAASQAEKATVWLNAKPVLDSRAVRAHDRRHEARDGASALARRPSRRWLMVYLALLAQSWWPAPVAAAEMSESGRNGHR